MFLRKIYKYIENKRFENLLKHLAITQQESRKEVENESRDDLFADTLNFMVQKYGSGVKY